VFLADGVAVVQIGDGTASIGSKVLRKVSPVDVVGLAGSVASLALGKVELCFCCLCGLVVASSEILK
jgi:hypothetical protein